MLCYAPSEAFTAIFLKLSEYEDNIIGASYTWEIFLCHLPLYQHGAWGLIFYIQRAQQNYIWTSTNNGHLSTMARIFVQTVLQWPVNSVLGTNVEVQL